MRIISFAAVPLLLVGGCAAIGTFSQQTGDLASGASDARVQTAEVREQQASAYNASLRLQLTAVEAHRVSLEQQVDDADAQLRRVRERLAASRAATAKQRADYRRLLREQQVLKGKLADMAAHPASTGDDAAGERAELDDLNRRKVALTREIDALQAGLGT